MGAFAVLCTCGLPRYLPRYLSLADHFPPTVLRPKHSRAGHEIDNYEHICVVLGYVVILGVRRKHEYAGIRQRNCSGIIGQRGVCVCLGCVRKCYLQSTI